MRFFIDMDGALYDTPLTDEQWWKTEKIFRYLSAQKKVVKAIKSLLLVGHEVYIIIDFNRTFSAPEEDKYYWLDQYLPEVNRKHRISVIRRKMQSFHIPNSITETDVLLSNSDDILEYWRKHGGEAVKLVYGPNMSDSWNGIIANANYSIRGLVDTLTKVKELKEVRNMIMVTRTSKSGRPRKITEKLIDELVIAYNEGASTKELSEKYHINIQTIRKVIKSRRP